MSTVPEAFLNPYDPSTTEDRMYALWEESGFFNPDALTATGIVDKGADTFSIVLPPPNVTGTLHLGHAFESTLQDILVRSARMRGYKTLWIPGTDSAAIATQARVEKALLKEGKTRHDVGREALVERIQRFAKDSEGTILSQIKKMGASLDWSRYAYTLDEKRSRAVNHAFVQMYRAGLIFRGDRIVNWDPRGQTTISDDEVIYTEEKAKFYYLKYGPFIIGTARPETKFGDKYVVIHPHDSRYSTYTHGQTIDLEWINGPITATIIKDEAANPEFGSGAMTITPWHSQIDFEIAERHELDKVQIIDHSGKLLPIAEEFKGLHIKKAREKIVEKLKQKGLLVKIDEDYTHNLARAERTNEPIEPQIMRQWFVGVDKSFTIPHSEIPNIQSGSTTTLKTIMCEAASSGAIKIWPERFEKSYFHWIDNLHDWCISRQIWFGHRIPVWYRNDEVYCSETAPTEDGWTQDEDVLDTWFSSALWTFSTLGWPENTRDLKIFHPTSFMSPAYEILYLWISRMILMSGFHLGQIPFKEAMIHGLVRDAHGRKFSKSLDNGIDPIDIIEKYGADALRMGLMVGAAPGNDTRFDEAKVRGYKHFANKIWNVARFILSQTDDARMSERPVLAEGDTTLIADLESLGVSVTEHIDARRLDLAADELYHYMWHTLADVIIEESKAIFRGADATAKASRQWTLRHILITNLKLLHPFMPFVTEAIWQTLPQKESELLMTAQWPRH